MSGKKSIFHFIEHFANLSRQAEYRLKNEKTYWNLQCLVSGSNGRKAFHVFYWHLMLEKDCWDHLIWPKNATRSSKPFSAFGLDLAPLHVSLERRIQESTSEMYLPKFNFLTKKNHVSTRYRSYNLTGIFLADYCCFGQQLSYFWWRRRRDFHRLGVLSLHVVLVDYCPLRDVVLVRYQLRWRWWLGLQASFLAW